MTGCASFTNLLGLFFHRFLQSFELDQQHGRRVHGIAGVRGFLHHAQQRAVQHFDRDGSDGARGNLGDRIAGVLGASRRSRESF